VAIECFDCHGSKSPPDFRPVDSLTRNAETGGFIGSHRKHLDAAAKPADCTKCHPGSEKYSSSHRNGLISVSLDTFYPAVYRNGSSSFPQTPTPNLGSCTNVVCHNDGTSISSGTPVIKQTPVWGSASAQPCSACHDNPPGYNNGSPKANAHQKHNFYGYSCSRCHNATTSNGITLSSYSSSHGNRAYDVSAPPGENIIYSYGSTGGSCSATYCHSSAQGTGDPTAPPSYAAPSWNQQYGEGCINCHKGGYHTELFTRYMTSGSHKTHLIYESGRGCKTCHYQPIYENKTCGQCHLTFYGTHSNASARGPEHANGVIDVKIDPNMPVPGATGSYSGDPAPRTPYGNCYNLYCHSQGTRQLPPFEAPNVTDITWGGAAMPTDCTGCHGGDGLSSIPIVTGSHSKHGAVGCTICHNSSASANRTAIPVTPFSGMDTNKSNHSNGIVNVAIAPSAGGRYGSETTSWDKLPGTQTLRCTNNYCHSSGVSVTTGSLFSNISTPPWGGAGLSCNSCHGNPPAYADTIPKANAHQTHSSHSCSRCHFNVTNDGTTITGRALHANSEYNLAAGPGTGFTYTYSTLGGSCADVSCHPGGSIARVWSSSSCGSCHGAPPSDNAHARHFTGLPRMAAYGNSSTTSTYLNNCGVCHPAEPARDNDGSLQVELFNPSTPPSSLKSRSTAAEYANGSCSNIYCHSDGSSVASTLAPAAQTVAWNAPPMTCNSCHGNPPAYESGNPKANSHAVHDVYSCSICHATTTSTGTTITDQFRHINASYDLAARSDFPFNYTFDPAGGSCDSNSCHSDGTYPRLRLQVSNPVTATWGASPLSCSGCHGNPPLYVNRLNSHPAHIKYSCSSCHYLVTSNGSSITNRVLHANSAINVNPSPGISFSYRADIFYFTYYESSCSNISCHNDGTAVATGTPNLTQSMAGWGSDYYARCNSCHGNPPVYVSGSLKKNSHSKHSGYGCQTCHYSVTTNGTTITDRNLHVNNQYVVDPAPGTTFSYSFATSGGNCTNTSCHNDGTGVATGSQNSINPSTWGDTFSCGSCHGNPPSYSSTLPKKNSHLGSHAAIGCQFCHAAVTTTGSTITTPALHINKQYNVTPGAGTGFAYTYNASGGSCANIYCHSDGTSIITTIIRSNTATWGGQSLGCNGCHGNPPTTNVKRNSHAGNHSGIGCQICHYTVTTNGVTISDPTKHMNNTYEVAPGPGTSFTSNENAICSNTSCHSDGTAVATGVTRSTGNSSQWGWSKLNCDSCHANPPAYVSGNPKKNSHSKHSSSGGRCWYCHYDTMTSDSTTISNPAKHKNAVYDLKPNPTRSFNYSYSANGGTCSMISCHGDGTSIATGILVSPTPSQWGGASLECSSCHGYPPSYPNGSPKKNSHTRHQGYDCLECHGLTVYSSTYISSTYHVNGQYDLYGPRTGTYTFNSNGGSCSSVKCHSNGTYVATGILASPLAPLAWGTNSNLTCTACHGMPPEYPNGYPKGNSHGLHKDLSIDCTACHATVTSDGTSISDRSKHANGQYDVTFANSTSSFTYLYKSGGSSCSDVACHPTEKKNINWNIFAQMPISFFPVNNDNYAPIDQSIKVVFTEDMDPASLSAEGVFTLVNGSTPVPGTVSYDQATKTASFTPNTLLDYSNPYTAALTNAVRNLSGQQIQSSYTWSFTTTNSAGYTTLVDSNFDLLSFGYLSGDGSWSVITPGWNGGTYLSGMSQGYAKSDETTKIDAQLQTWSLDLSTYQSLKLRFNYNVKISPPSVADVDISVNGADGPWNNIWRISAPYANYSYQSNASFNLSTVAKGQQNVMIRFRFTPQTPSNNGWWAVDNVIIGGDPR
jgi:predicted CxxxxCH...CXXCH cytochrome family protein